MAGDSACCDAAVDVPGDSAPPDGPAVCSAVPDIPPQGLGSCAPLDPTWVVTWPIEADPTPCTNFVGDVYPTTGPGAANWFIWQCGAWKDYAVASGCRFVIKAWGDCAWMTRVEYEIWQRKPGGSYTLREVVQPAPPDPDPCDIPSPPHIGQLTQLEITPVSDIERIRIVARRGFYVCVYQH